MLGERPERQLRWPYRGSRTPCRLRRPSPSTEGDKCRVVTAGSDVSFIEEIGAARRYSRREIGNRHGNADYATSRSNCLSPFRNDVPSVSKPLSDGSLPLNVP